MTRNGLSSRRLFLKAGAVLSAPMAVAPAAVLAGDGANARLARLEDERAIRDLHQIWMRSVNAGTTSSKRLALLTAGAQTTEGKVRSIGAHLAAPPDEVKFAPDGKMAMGRFHCAIEIEMPLAKDCTLAQMAHLQGSGFVRRTETGVLNVEYIKTGEAWSVAQVKFAAAEVHHHEAAPRT